MPEVDYRSAPRRRNSTIDTVAFDKEWLGRVLMKIGPDNYRSVMHLSIERLTARGNADEDVIECLTGDYRFLQWRRSFSRRRTQSSTCRIAILNLVSVSIRKYQFVEKKQWSELQLKIQR